MSVKDIHPAEALPYILEDIGVGSEEPIRLLPEVIPFIAQGWKRILCGGHRQVLDLRWKALFDGHLP